VVEFLSRAEILRAFFHQESVDTFIGSGQTHTHCFKAYQPTEWSWVSVDQIATLVQYGSSAKTSDALSDGVPVLRMGNIVDGKLDYQNLKYLPRNHGEFPELLLTTGDILFNRTNSAESSGSRSACASSRHSHFARNRITGRLDQRNPHRSSRQRPGQMEQRYTAS
jgi:hypothetical protein